MRIVPYMMHILKCSPNSNSQGIWPSIFWLKSHSVWLRWMLSLLYCTGLPKCDSYPFWTYSLISFLMWWGMEIGEVTRCWQLCWFLSKRRRSLYSAGLNFCLWIAVVIMAASKASLCSMVTFIRAFIQLELLGPIAQISWCRRFKELGLIACSGFS